MAHPLATRLGRIKSPDVRNYDPAYSMEQFVGGLAPEQLIHKIDWASTTQGLTVLDQGDTPKCTAYSARHHVNLNPHAHPDLGPSADDIYTDEKQVDGIPNEDGSTVHATAKVLRKLGLIDAYYWGHAEWTMRKWVLTHGPVAIGVNWYEDMFDPDAQNIVHINNSSVAGGHAFEVVGYDYDCFDKLPKTQHGLYKCMNSWGPGWGEGGFFYVGLGDMARLISEDGECMDALNWDGATKLT